MEINKPDQGIFKGIGALQQNNHINNNQSTIILGQNR